MSDDDDLAATPGASGVEAAFVFAMVGDELQLVGDLDYEWVTGYELTVVVEDGLGADALNATIAVSVAVEDVNDVVLSEVSPLVLSTDGGDTVTITGEAFGPARTGAAGNDDVAAG